MHRLKLTDFYNFRYYLFMRFKKLIPIAFVLLTIQSYSQKKQEVLFTVDNEPVTTAEFLKVFNKNRDIVDEENKKTIEEYLELYINYKLKLKQAYQIKLDTVTAYKQELKKYREQLILPYLKDSKVTELLVKEAYERMKNEVNASHILVLLNPKATPKDTLRAYNKIIEARTKVMNGAAFNEIAKQYSEDPSAKKNGGNLGYFSTFAMVYPFENVAYKNKIGTVSMPFKTSFGYHIIRVNDRRISKGEVEVAHIMIQNKKEDAAFAKKQINEVHAKLLQGDAFDFLAKQHSDDKNSAIRGGRLAKFSASRMIKPFSDVAFSLENIEDISKPFETQYGWHIVKLLKKHPVKNYDELKDELSKKIEKSQRAAIVGKSIAGKLKKQYSIVVNKSSFDAYMKNDTTIISKSVENPIVTINDKKVLLKNLIAYNNSQQKKTLKVAYEDFLNQEIITYYKDNLESTNVDFASIIQEYKDGLLLFDLLQDKIWTRAEKDTLALRNFFNENRSNYKWKQRANLILASCTKPDKASLVKELLSQNKTIKEIKQTVNEGATINVLFSEGILEVGNEKLPKEYIFQKGVSKVFKHDKNHYVIIKATKIIAPTLKKLKEAKGLIINDFQKYIENKWITNLRTSYKVKVKKKVLKRIVKENAN